MSIAGTAPPEKLGFVSRFLMRLAGLQPDLAVQHPYELPQLKGLGYQFFGVFLLLFFIQGYAFSLLLGEQWWIGYGFAFLTASIIMSADRAFLSHDYYLEGELEYARLQNPDDLKIPKLEKKRLTSLFVRYAFGIVISVAVVHFAEPGILAPEVQSYTHAEEVLRNSKTYDDIDAFEETKFKENASVLKELAILREARTKAQTELDDLIDASELVVPQISQEEIRTLKSKSTQLELDALRFDDCAQAEATGTADASCPEVKPSGIPGCRERCKRWQKKASSARASSKLIAAEISSMREGAIDLANNVQEARSSEVGRLEDYINKLDSELVRKENAQKSGFSASLDQMKQYNDIRKEQPDFDDSGKHGVVRSYNAVHDIKEDQMKPGTKFTLLLLKVFLVVLESIVFTSRLLGSNKSYTVAMHLDYLNRNKQNVSGRTI
jgi:hypothetical protein